MVDTAEEVRLPGKPPTASPAQTPFGVKRSAVESPTPNIIGSGEAIFADPGLGGKFWREKLVGMVLVLPTPLRG